MNTIIGVGSNMDWLVYLLIDIARVIIFVTIIGLPIILILGGILSTTLISERIDGLKNVASKARLNFETGNFNSRRLKELYQQYTCVEDIDLFLEKAKIMFPKLNCGLATVYLHDMISNSRIVRGKYKNEAHTFLLVDNIFVVDITADQFGGPKVYVGALKYPWAPYRLI